MVLIDKAYDNYISNNDCLTLFPIDFITKYNCIAYAVDNEKLIVLINQDFSLFDYNKLYYFTEQKIELCLVNNDIWDKIFKLIEVSNSRSNAMFKYQNNKEELNYKVLKEDVTTFYRAEVSNAPIVKLLDSIIEEAITIKSSDIHIEPMFDQIKVRFRIDGKLVDDSTLPIESMNEISNRLKVIANLDITKKHLPQDGKIIYKLNDKEYDIRLSVLPTIYGERFALRILDTNNQYFTIDKLQFSDNAKPRIDEMLEMKSGLVLVVGPTGSGKSTTLKSILLANKERNENIITVEDPVEYTIEGISQTQINEESGLTFANALRTILRQDPNIIMVGEIRDMETAKIACRASITGHLVYSTLHTINSYGVINRLIDMGVEKFLLLDSLKVIISQRLIRLLCNNCKIAYMSDKEETKFLELEEAINLYKPCGCPKCSFTGYSGRRGVYEVVTIDEDFRKIIIDGKNSTKFYQLLKKKKIETLFENGRNLVVDGLSSIEELKSVIS